MATYRQVHTKIWGNEDIQKLSVNAKLLFIYLITCTHRNESGLFQISLRTIENETGIDNKNALKAFDEMAELGLAHYDKDTKECLVVSAVSFSTYKNERTIKSIAQNIASAKSDVLKYHFLKRHKNDKATAGIVELIIELDSSIENIELTRIKATEFQQCSNSVPTEYIDIALPLSSSSLERGMGKTFLELAPAELLTFPEFEEAWGEWLKYRKMDLKKPIKESTAKEQFKFLKLQPNPVAVIRESIRNTWQGLFPEKNLTLGQVNGTVTHNRTSINSRINFNPADADRSLIEVGKRIIAESTAGGYGT